MFTNSGRWTLACLVGAFALLALAACGGGGSDGADGPAGPAGPPGPEGPPAPPAIGEYDPLPGVNVVITALSGGTGAGGNFVTGNAPVVTFTVKTDAGDDIAVPDLSRLDLNVSGPTNNYQRVIASANMLASAVDLGGGSWRVTLPALPATYLAPLNDTTAIPTDTAHADPFGEWKGLPLDPGTYTVGIRSYREVEYEGETFRDVGMAVRDFLFGSATVLDPRDVVTNANCDNCHTEVMAHGSGRRDVRHCVLCHTSGAEDRNTAGATPGVTIDWRVMIHKIHNGAHLPSVNGVATNLDGTRNYLATAAPYEIMGYGDNIIDFSAVGFPVWPNLNVSMPRDLGYSALTSAAKSQEGRLLQGVTACAKCHGDPDGAGPLPAPADGGFAETNPSRQACGSCHDDIDWTRPYAANGATMLANFTNDTCAPCHPVTGYLSVRDGHRHPFTDPAVNPGINVGITGITGGTGPSGKFQAGDSPAITFTVKNDANVDVPLASCDSSSSFLAGPTTNLQLVTPFASTNGMTASPFDGSGRLQASSTTNKGSMTKVFPGATGVTEVLTLECTSSTTFSAAGSTSGALGTVTLPVSTSSYPSGASLGGWNIGPMPLGSETVTVDFTSSTAFTVTGSLSGVLGSGTLPNATSASTRFTSTLLSFNVSVGTTALTGGTTKWRIALFQGPPANPVRFGVVAGTSAFSSTAPRPDRFYYEFNATAPTYTVNLPTDYVYEFLGDSTNTIGQTLTAANLPMWYGRQQLWEATAGTTTTTTTAALAARGRSVAVVPATGFANNDVVVVEPLGAIGVREYVAISPMKADGTSAGAADTTATIWFKTPLRYAHASGVSITKVTTALKQEGAANEYVLTPATGVVTSNVAFSAGVGMVMSYRANAQFGWRRHFGDTLQAVYVPPANDTPDLDETVGDWQGKPFADGTYMAALWLYVNRDLGLQNEVQTYRGTSPAGEILFLYGAATSITPQSVIGADEDTCLKCHDDLLFHGGGRRGLVACITCHDVSAAEDLPRWNTATVSGSSPATPTALTPGQTVEFRSMLHKIHKGEELAYGATWTVVGNGGTPHTYGEVVFPTWPGGVKQCVACHGNESWNTGPMNRTYPGSAVVARVWSVVCGSCHDADDAQAHITSNVSPAGAEACEVCHGEGKVADVVKVHIPR